MGRHIQVVRRVAGEGEVLATLAARRISRAVLEAGGCRLAEEVQHGSDVLGDHLPLALLDEEAGARLEVGREGPRASEPALLAADLLGRTGGNNALLPRPPGGLVYGADSHISHQQKGLDLREEV
ncbi:MAG: hypothetical protein OEV76_05120 [Anaerolineae bacterium]|nr:hypothetical protein [Anaerolineae bacterium]